MKRPVQHQNYYSCPHPSTSCMFTLVRLRPDSGHSTNNGSQPPNVTSALSARSHTANRCASMLSHSTLHISFRHSCHQLRTIAFGGHFKNVRLSTQYIRLPSTPNRPQAMIEPALNASVSHISFVTFHFHTHYSTYETSLVHLLPRDLHLVRVKLAHNRHFPHERPSDNPVV